MIIANDIIFKLIKDKGYKSVAEFCRKNDINFMGLRRHAKFNNSWTKELLEKISKALDCDLSFLVNATIGAKKREKPEIDK